MTIAVGGSENFFTALKSCNGNVEWVLVNKNISFKNMPSADAYFFEIFNQNHDDYYLLNAPVFINAVSGTLPAMPDIIRFNGWPGFIEQGTWELTGNLNDKAKDVLHALSKEYILCKDEPGFITPRIIAMIINEAYMAKAEDVSTEKEIDTAMKLGTNYPYGPFEWAQKIGTKNILALLEKLAEKDDRYIPAEGLKETAKIN